MHLLVLSAFRPPHDNQNHAHHAVSMHLLVLSAFRPRGDQATHILLYESQCTFWCSVLSDAKGGMMLPRSKQSQCTFWCSVLSDRRRKPTVGTPTCGSQCTFWCSVLSDRRRKPTVGTSTCGSQCTFWCSVLSDRRPPGQQVRAPSLNAPFGAQCFPTKLWELINSSKDVSMHLLVLSAFRQPAPVRSWQSARRLNAPFGAQCFPTGRNRARRV